MSAADETLPKHPSKIHLPQLPHTIIADFSEAELSELTGEKKEKCGIFGIAGPSDAVERCYYGLYALQHRGQESAGIAASDGTVINAHSGLGLVADVFKKDVIKELRQIDQTIKFRVLY